MRRNFSRAAISAATAALALAAISCSDVKEVRPVLKGDFFGYKPPRERAEIFAPGVISLGFHELTMTFSPGMDEAFYITSDRGYNFYAVIQMTRSGGVWSQPGVAPFSGHGRDMSVIFDPAGDRVYFCSDRPAVHEVDFWSVEKKDGRWGEPVNISAAIDGFQGGLSLTVSAAGTIYFQDNNGDIFRSRREGDGYARPEKLPGSINTGAHEGRPFIASDESYLIFNSARPGGFGQSDIYITFRKEDGGWTEAENMGLRINSPALDFAATVSPDGKALFFSSYRRHEPEAYEGKDYGQLVELLRSPGNGYATLYWIDAGIIEQFKNIK